MSALPIRAVLRDTLLLTLAKSQEEKQSLGQCFDLFFQQPEITSPATQDNQPDAQPSEQQTSSSEAAESMSSLGPLAQMLMSQDRNAIAAAVANAANAAGLSDIRFFTQRGIYSSRILDRTRHHAATGRSRRLDCEQSGTSRAACGGDRSAPGKRSRYSFTGAASVWARRE